MNPRLRSLVAHLYAPGARLAANTGTHNPAGATPEDLELTGAHPVHLSCSLGVTAPSFVFHSLLIRLKPTLQFISLARIYM